MVIVNLYSDESKVLQYFDVLVCSAGRKLFKLSGSIVIVNVLTCVLVYSVWFESRTDECTM